MLITTYHLVKWLLLLVIVGGLLSGEAQAQVFGQTARTEFFGGWGIRVFYSRINKTQLLIDGKAAGLPGTPEVFVNMTPVTVVYGVQPKLSLIGVFPLVSRTLERTIDQRRVSETDAGPGDIILYAKYRFYKQDRPRASRQFSAQLGVKLPTGADDRQDEQGQRFAPPLQLGTGSLDWHFVLTATEARDRWLFAGDVAYNLKTTANRFRFGDVFSYDAAVKFRLYPARFGENYTGKDLYLFLELNGLIAQKSRMAGQKLPDSGGHSIFLAPGFQFFPVRNIIFESGIQLPVWQNLNGSQLGTDFQLRSGLRWII